MKPKLIVPFIVTSALLGLFNFSVNPKALAIPINQVVNPRQYSNGWVTDQARVLSPSAIAQLNATINQVKAKTGTEITVVTVPDIYPLATPKEFATELYNRWHIGQKGQDNGVLLLVTLKERRVEIETGYGVEGILPDSKAGNIISNKIIPYFKAGDYQGGIIAGTQALAQELITTPFDQQPSETSPVPLLVVLGGGVAGLGAVSYLWKTRKRYLPPFGRSQGSNPRAKSEFYCAECKNLMAEFDSANLQKRLNAPQHCAQQLRSTAYRGWQCPKCATIPPEGRFHLRSYLLSSAYALCPNCQEYTLLQQDYIIQEPTLYTQGVMRTVSKCPCCSLHHEKDSWIPRKTPVVIYTGGGGGGGGFGGGGGGFGGGSSGGGGGFGGGSSGGGGAGGSW